MNLAIKVSALLIAAAVPISSAIAQTEITTPQSITPDMQQQNMVEPVPQTQLMQTPQQQQLAPSTQAAPTANLSTESATEFLSSLAEKFGTSVSRLQSLLAKLPPRGSGLSRIEISVISSKLGLTPEEKEIFRSRVGAGGTGFTADDVVGMGERLGLSSAETARLSQELGLASPAVATPYPMTPSNMPASMTAPRSMSQSAIINQPSTTNVQPTTIMQPLTQPAMQDAPVVPNGYSTY
jgi:hypothetical protein